MFNGLKDLATYTELVVLALYHQAIGRPYMKYMRSTTKNALKLGPFHKRVKDHCRAIINEPGLLLAFNAQPTTGALEGKVWDQPNLMYRVAHLSNTLPHLQEILVAFFEGALKTWERFTTEFAPGSIIAQASPAQRDSV